MMEYKGYVARVEFDAEANLFHGEVIDTRDVITFQATSVDALWQAFHDSVDDYLDFCAERGEEPEKPFSGKLHLRMEPDLHRMVTICSARAGLSLNAWIVARLSECATEVLTPAPQSAEPTYFSHHFSIHSAVPSSAIGRIGGLRDPGLRKWSVLPALSNTLLADVIVSPSESDTTLVRGSGVKYEC